MDILNRNHYTTNKWKWHAVTSNDSLDNNDGKWTEFFLHSISGASKHWYIYKYVCVQISV